MCGTLSNTYKITRYAVHHHRPHKSVYSLLVCGFLNTLCAFFSHPWLASVLRNLSPDITTGMKLGPVFSPFHLKPCFHSKDENRNKLFLKYKWVVLTHTASGWENNLWQLNKKKLFVHLSSVSFAITFSHSVMFIDIAHVCIVALDYMVFQSIPQSSRKFPSVAQLQVGVMHLPLLSFQHAAGMLLWNVLKECPLFFSRFTKPKFMSIPSVIWNSVTKSNFPVVEVVKLVGRCIVP